MNRLALALALALASCTTPGENPPAPGFDAQGSDSKAIEIADESMRAMGGRAAWDATRVLGWTFGRRAYLWDKRTGQVIVFDGERVTQVDVDSRMGTVLERGAEITEPKARAEALERAYRQWLTESYWLVMPYKLKDSGVTLNYGGESSLADGRPADKLVVTLKSAGAAPSKYDVYVARDTHLVEQWSYYPGGRDAKPEFTTPWKGWTRYGKILLSGDRGQMAQLTDIAVFDAPPPRLKQ
jgi:hypothetical protein